MTKTQAEMFLNEDSFNQMLNEARNPEQQPEQSQEQVIEENQEVENTEYETSQEEYVEEYIEEPVKDIRIPKSRLDEESAKRYAAEEQIKLLAEQNRLLMEKLLGNPQQQTQQQEPELDVLDEDAHRYYTAQQKKLEAELNALKNEIKNTQQKTQIENYVATATNQFKQKVSDYEDTVNSYLKFKTDEALSMFDDIEQAEQYVESQLENLTKAAIKKGQNPAEIVYNLARKTGVARKPSNPTAKSVPNLAAINQNMKKSVHADSNNSATSAPSLPANLKSLGKEYFLDDNKFNQLLELARKGR